MSNLDRLTITVPSEMSSWMQSAIDGGSYASISEVVREAIREWHQRHANKASALEELRAAIKIGMDELEAGKGIEFNVDDIIRRGREKLAKRTK